MPQHFFTKNKMFYSKPRFPLFPSISVFNWFYQVLLSAPYAVSWGEPAASEPSAPPAASLLPAAVPSTSVPSRGSQNWFIH